MESKTYIRYIRISPKKLRFILDDVRRMKPAEVLPYLQYSPKRSSKILYKVIKSAIDTALIGLKVDSSMLQFKTLVVSDGPSLKRMRPGSRGAARLYKRRSSHVVIVLGKESAKVKKGELEKVEPATTQKRIETKEAKKVIKKKTTT